MYDLDLLFPLRKKIWKIRNWINRNSLKQKCKINITRGNKSQTLQASSPCLTPSFFSLVPMSRSSLQEWSPPAQWRPPVAPPCPHSIMPHPRRPQRPNQTGPTSTYRPRSRSLIMPTLWTTGTAACSRAHLHHIYMWRFHWEQIRIRSQQQMHIRVLVTVAEWILSGF